MRKALGLIFFLTIFFISAKAVTDPVRLRRICSTPSGDVVIFWNGFSDGCSSFTKLYLYGKQEVGKPFKIIDSVFDPLQTEYTHLGAKLLSQQWKYYIEVFYACDGSTTLLSDTMSIDFAPPDDVIIDSVSVIDGKTQIGWEKSGNGDNWGYYVYLFDGFDNNIIDTIYGSEITTYLDSVVGKPEKKSETYRVAAFDSCGNISLLGGLHKTIFLASQIDTCAGIITLNWSAYQGWADKLNGYEIWVQENGGDFRLQDAIGLDNTYNFKGAERGKDYCFFVRALHSNGDFTSSSNRICTKGNFVDYQGEVYLSKVTVMDSMIEVHWQVDQEQFLGGFKLLRGRTPSTLDTIRVIPSNGNFSYVFRDSSANESVAVYYYKIVPRSICGIAGKGSNVSHNILLIVVPKEAAELRWNEYDGWGGGVQAYEVNRSSTQEQPLTFIDIAILQKEITEFPDEEKIEEVGNLGVCYVIEAIEGDTNEYGIKANSLSNMVCVIDEPIIHVPNAFRPAGMNNTFAPRGLFIDYASSTMAVYDRWGEKIFETNNVNKGWDGSDSKGNQAPEGIYYYSLTIWGLDGSRHIITGNVTKF